MYRQRESEPERLNGREWQDEAREVEMRMEEVSKESGESSRK